MKILKNNKGASEVVGALMLIAIVVVAASGIAVITAEMQKNEAERQSNVESVEKENLKIMSIGTILNSSDSNLIESMNITLMNLNSKESRVAMIVINDKAAANYSSTDAYNAPANYTYYDRLLIPPGQSRQISINFTGENRNFDPEYNLSTNKPIKLSIISDHSNNFMKIYNPPTPVFKTTVETENLGVAERDVLMLDASESFDDGNIMEYNWSITNSTGNASYATGRKTRVVLSQKGPFNVSLSLLDDTNMRGISKEVPIPANQKFTPPISMTTPRKDYNMTFLNIPVTLKDSEGNPVPGVTVSFLVMSGSYVLDRYVDETSSTGTATAVLQNVTTGGILRIEADKISTLVSVS